MEQLSRQARRELARQQAKEKYQMTDTGTTITQETVNLLSKQIAILNNSIKVLDNHFWLLIETQERKGYLKWEDLNETENIYTELNKKKADKVRELLAQDLTLPEIVEIAREDLVKPKLERLNLNPFKDLNCNPYQFADFLRSESPDLTKEEYMRIGQSWGLTLDHFGFEKEGEVK